MVHLSYEKVVCSNVTPLKNTEYDFYRPADRYVTESLCDIVNELQLLYNHIFHKASFNGLRNAWQFHYICNSATLLHNFIGHFIVHFENSVLLDRNVKGILVYGSVNEPYAASFTFYIVLATVNYNNMYQLHGNQSIFTVVRDHRNKQTYRAKVKNTC